MKSSHARTEGDGPVIDHLMAAGEMLASQLPVATSWSPEKRLAAAVLTSALISLRDRQQNAHCYEEVEEDRAWVASDDVVLPFAFLRLCDVFGLDAAWVRQVVGRWTAFGAGPRRTFSMHRHAA